LVVKSERKNLLAKYRGRYKDNIKMHLVTIRGEGAGWIHLAQDGEQ
jgi:hypothetical protein